MGFAVLGLAEATHDAARLLRELGADDHRVRDRAEEQLRRLGAEAIPQLRANRESADPEIRWLLGRLLAAIGPDVRGFLAGKATCRGQAGKAKRCGRA